MSKGVKPSLPVAHISMGVFRSSGLAVPPVFSRASISASHASTLLSAVLGQWLANPTRCNFAASTAEAVSVKLIAAGTLLEHVATTGGILHTCQQNGGHASLCLTKTVTEGEPHGVASQGRPIMYAWHQAPGSFQGLNLF